MHLGIIPVLEPRFRDDFIPFMLDTTGYLLLRLSLSKGYTPLIHPPDMLFDAYGA